MKLRELTVRNHPTHSTSSTVILNLDEDNIPENDQSSENVYSNTSIIYDIPCLYTRTLLLQVVWHFFVPVKLDHHSWNWFINFMDCWNCMHWGAHKSQPWVNPWWILGLKYVLIDMWGAMINTKWCFPTSNCKILYLTILIVRRKNLNQSDCTDCKIITIEGEEKAFLVGSPDRCQCFDIQ
jgi:hypothetical protein